MVWWGKPCFYFMLSPDDLREESGGGKASPWKRDGHKRSQMVRKRIICQADVLQPIKHLCMICSTCHFMWFERATLSIHLWNTGVVTALLQSLCMQWVVTKLMFYCSEKVGYWSRKFSSTRRYQKNVKKKKKRKKQSAPKKEHFGCGKKKNTNKSTLSFALRRMIMILTSSIILWEFDFGTVYSV